MMKLYYSPGACSLAPHIVLRETGQEVTLEKVDLKAKKTETGADFREINPKGYVPVLQLDDGGVLTEGVVIQQYIADRSPEIRLAPSRGTTERMRLEELLVFISTELHKGYTPLFAPTTPEEAKPAFREKIGKYYGIIETTLADGRPYLTGEAFTIADAYLYVIAGWSRPVSIDLSPWPKLTAFMQRVGERPAVQAARVAEGLPAKG
jgi:glutathione S-transferase